MKASIEYTQCKLYHMKILSIELTNAISRKELVEKRSFVIFVETPLKREFVLYHRLKSFSSLFSGLLQYLKSFQGTWSVCGLLLAV